MRSRLPLLVVLIVAVIDAMGIGLIMPVMPELIQEVSGSDLAHAAVWGGILTTAFAVMQFLFGPVVGNLSDRFGRRPVMLVSLSVMALDYLVMALAPNIWILLAGRIVGGITAATISTANAYMADISAPGDKARRFGYVGAAFGIGFVMGPALGGLLGELGTRAPFFAAAALAAGTALFGYLSLRESLPARLRRPFRWARANPFGALRAVARLAEIRMLLLTFFLYQVALIVYMTIWPYFGTALFGWSPGMVGMSLALYGSVYALTQGALVAPAIRAWGDRRTVMVGLVLELVFLLFYGLMRHEMLILISVPFAALAAIGAPALQSILSRRVGDDQQGELQGVLSSLVSLATILAPVVMTQVFARFSGNDAPVFAPGAPFLLSAAIMLATIALFWRSRRRV
ncbi:TCR/Tet family MFS transporter [Shimia sp.]|uniref:TCR/Tet family MFS transporter n=1 Tax=Shimia sp. TaxID=1954381 RepID=UPI0035672E26